MGPRLRLAGRASRCLLATSSGVLWFVLGEVLLSMELWEDLEPSKMVGQKVGRDPDIK